MFNVKLFMICTHKCDLCGITINDYNLHKNHKYAEECITCTKDGTVYLRCIDKNTHECIHCGGITDKYNVILTHTYTTKCEKCGCDYERCKKHNPHQCKVYICEFVN